MSIYQKRYRYGKKGYELEDVDITSLLDILVILLVFLLKSYNASDLKVNLMDNLFMPESVSRVLGSHGTILQVSEKEELSINDEVIGNMADARTLRKLSDELDRIWQQEGAKTQQARATHINIVMDKKLPYSTLDKIMKIAATRKFENFKFIVKGDY